MHKTGTVEITVSYGYDIHTIKLSRRTFDRILRGDKVEIEGQGFPTEEGWTQDRWIFTTNERGEVDVRVYCDDSRDVYLGGPWLRIDPPEAYRLPSEKPKLEKLNRKVRSSLINGRCR
jgi:hypothetical protein